MNNLSTLIDLLKAAQGAIKLSTGDEAHNYIQAVIDELQHSGMVSVPAPQPVNQQLVQALEVVLECGSINDQWWLDKVRAALSAEQEQQHEM